MDTTPLFEFSDRAELRQWLEENHGTTPFCWVSTTRGKELRSGAIPYPEVVEECLCFGWIDFTVKRLDEGWQAQRISPRKKGSTWTILNTRRFRDLDIDYDSRETGKMLPSLKDAGFVVETDMMPVRMELHHQELGYLDIHPFELYPDGSARQADGHGDWFEFTPDVLGSAVFAGRTIPCISVKGQRLFHTGYELRKKDIHDLHILSALD